MRKSIHILMVGMFLVPFGCLDSLEIDLPVHDLPSRVAIHGVVERSDQIYRFLIRVSKPKALMSVPIDQEEIVDIDLIYNQKPILSVENGVEFTIPISSFHQIYGGTPDDALFNIRVSLGPAVFESVPQTILRTPDGSHLKLSYHERQELNDIENVVTTSYVKLLVNTPVTNADQKRVSFRWDVSGVYLFREVIWTLDTSYDPRFCYVSDLSGKNEINVVNSRKINGDFVRDFEINETLADHRFATGYYYTVIQRAISESAAEFWGQINSSIDRKGTLYDPPAGIVSSNIRQIEGNPIDVQGYFYTAGIDTIRILSTRDETGNQPHLCAPNIISEVCCNCILILNSSYVKPFYWK